MTRITRDAFLYLEPRHGTDKEGFAQCGTCRKFAPQLKRCITLGSRFEVGADDSCALYEPWPTPDGAPVKHVVANHAAELRQGIPGAVTPKAAGFVPHKVQCHRCEFAGSGATHCGLFAKLNKALPEYFDLDPRIHPHGCCNAHEPREGTTHRSPSAGRQVARALDIARKKTKQRILETA